MAGSFGLGVTKRGLSDASASAEVPVVLEAKSPTSNRWETFAALCVAPRFATPRYVAWQVARAIFTLFCARFRCIDNFYSCFEVRITGIYIYIWLLTRNPPTYTSLEPIYHLRLA